MSNLHLKTNPTLKDFQQYITDMEAERGLSQDILHNSLMLGEEVGELFKAIRKETKLQIDHNSKFGIIEEELTDVLIFVLALANRFNIDLEQAFRNKEEINKTRTWKKHKK